MGRGLDAQPGALSAARVRDALVRAALAAQGHDGVMAGCRALPAERGVADSMEGLLPGLGRMMLTVLEYHRRGIEWHMRGGDGSLPVPRAAGAVILGAGYPPPNGALHARGLAASPGARVCYVHGSVQVAAVANLELAAPDPGHVSVELASPADPGAVLRACAGLIAAGPVTVHLVLSASRWSPGQAAGAVAGYASAHEMPDGSKARLQPGSTVCLSVVAPDRDPSGELTPEGAAMNDAASLAGSPGYAHTGQDLARWIEDAGMRLHGPVFARRAFGPGWGDRYPPPPVAPEVPGRVIGAVGIVA